MDAIPFTPFNAHVIRFRVKRPYTIAILAQDWEDKLGLGMEVFQGNSTGIGGWRVRCKVLRWDRDEQHVEGAVVLHRTTPAP